MKVCAGGYQEEWEWRVGDGYDQDTLHSCMECQGINIIMLRESLCGGSIGAGDNSENC